MLQLEHISRSQQIFRRYHQDKTRALEASLAGIHKSTGHLRPQQRIKRPHSAPAVSYGSYNPVDRYQHLTGRYLEFDLDSDKDLVSDSDLVADSYSNSETDSDLALVSHLNSDLG